MSSRDDRARWVVGRAALILWGVLALSSPPLQAQELGASTPPRGRFIVRVFPKAFYASAYFSEEGKALNLETVTGLLYVELPLQVQYGITGALAVGATLPLGWTYQEVRPEIREDPVHRFAVREVWLSVQHKWWTLSFISTSSLTCSSSLRVKIPLADKVEWEDGLRIGDGQVDVYPSYFLDYIGDERLWFTELALGYKYRFKNGDIKPFDELNFRAVLGLGLLDDGKMDVFVLADLTRFRNGDYGSTDLAFFEREGSLHTLGYGVSLKPNSEVQIYLETAGDFSGRNRYRGMHWTVGMRKYFGSGR